MPPPAPTTRRSNVLGTQSFSRRARSPCDHSGESLSPAPTPSRHPLPVTALLKELTIRFSVSYRPDEFREVIAAFSNGAIDPTPVVGPMLDLDRISEAFDLVRNARVKGRVLVAPGATDHRGDRA
jgi:threonine dehydrogenase-like Zn-dependent dehydrogenase